MKTVIFAAIAAATVVSAPAFAQDAAPFTGPRAGVTAGFDKAQGEEGFAYGVTAGYDIAVTPRITFGPELSFGDSTVDGNGIDASREIAGSIRAGYVVTPQILAFGKVGYTSARIEAAGAHTSLEGVRYGGGLEYSVTPNTYISAEYQRTEYEDNFGGRDAGLVGIGFRF
ncbi:outer membrane immunogenic protein [Sphingobium sp. AP50]|jgi:outer membrane immunogenic protein|uniref:porin family protein n=1 Tax=unclassified Sphingobium TaxID=2611147 RepID=UPI0008D4AC13|nr:MULTISPECIES: porin family protein [unclassified Sphingobium]SEI62805.1 outer membrane immunogenic protein [Sphingobium sp. AP50]SER03190.1 outer membrane immunogenic protein [Sphingobium sp. YR768]